MAVSDQRGSGRGGLQGSPPVTQTAMTIYMVITAMITHRNTEDCSGVLEGTVYHYYILLVYKFKFLSKLSSVENDIVKHFMIFLGMMT